MYLPWISQGDEKRIRSEYQLERNENEAKMQKMQKDLQAQKDMVKVLAEAAK